MTVMTSTQIAPKPPAARAVAPVAYERHFNRFELKFRLHHRVVEQLMKRIQPYLDSDPNQEPDGRYRVTSLYYDSPSLSCFWEKLDGIKFRRKLRVRFYGDSNDCAFLEIKQRIDQTTQKRRTRGVAESLIDELSLDRGGRETAIHDPILDEARCLVHLRRLTPRVVVGYQRAAYFGRYERGLRVTVDSNLRFEKYRGRFSSLAGRGRFILPPTIFVLELKYNERIPLWLCSALNSLNVQPDRVSKYCHAMDWVAYRGTVLASPTA